MNYSINRVSGYYGLSKVKQAENGSLGSKTMR
jgi:hypothetical protein